MENRVEAVERALSILAVFTAEDSELSLAVISQRTGLYKSTILRLLGSLERFGYIRRGSEGLYRLGPMLWELGMRCRDQYDVEGLIRPHLRELRDRSGETAAYWVRSGQSRICLYRENSRKAVRHHLDEGSVLPLERGASGRVLLAFSGEPGESSERIRAAGSYISRGERDPDVMAIAVPIFAPDGALMGALSVTGLNSRVDDKAAAAGLELLNERAAIIATELAR